MRADALRHTAAAIPWLPAVIASVVSVAVVAASHGQATVAPLQLASVLLSTAAAFALDDPAFEVLAPSPSSLMHRRWARMGVVLAPTMSLWATLVLWHGTAGREETLTLVAMFAGLLGLAFGISGLVGRRSGGRGGSVAAPAILVAIAVSSLIDPRWRPLPFGDIPGGWSALQTRWGVAAAVGAAILAASSVDPAGRRIGRTGPRRPHSVEEGRE
ncbi:hypothetical protein BH24ACT7_BH24ACT7_23010 [soil metagenome]